MELAKVNGIMYQDCLIIDGLQYCHWDRSYLQSLQENGISAVHVTLVYHEDARQTLSCFAKWNALFEQNADVIMPVYKAEDIVEAKKQHKVGIFFGAQNCSPIDDEIGLVEVMRQQGLLIMQLSYNNQSLVATGCYEEHDLGVTRFGKQVIAEMNRVGMIIDMSHSAERSTLETIDLSSRPICISHANPSVVHPALRNKSTAVLQALAARGGLFGFSLYPFHLPHFTDCSLEEFCQMVAYTADLIGVDHLAIGSDLCLNQPCSVLDWMRNGRWAKEKNFGEGSENNAGWPMPVAWFKDARGMQNIYHGLIEYGFDPPDVAKILGQNWLDFLQQGLRRL